MPSTHAAWTAAVACAAAIAFEWPTRRTQRIAALALGCLVAGIGACLVYLGTHWPSDVLVGWLLGSAIAAAATPPITRWRPQSPLRTG